MLPPLPTFRLAVRHSLSAARAEGHDVSQLTEEFSRIPDSYDALNDFAHRLAASPLREDWPYVEPLDLPSIWKECDPARPTQPIAAISLSDASARAETAFLSSVCGCMLGKPVEVNPTLADMREALQAIGDWPLRDYISNKLNLRRRSEWHFSAPETCRETIQYAAPDDDINYTILGMLNLEKNGLNFTQDQLRQIWQRSQSFEMTWGPERAILARCGVHFWGEEMGGPTSFENYAEWTNVINPFGELCGALIRADAYGYACPGQPALAAELAFRDASFTHRRTGVYGTMFVAAAIATAFVARQPLEIFETALQFVPRRSRFYNIVADSLTEVRAASDWMDGYARIHGKYKEYSHCRIYQECGTLINSARFAENIDDGFCKQVSQGNDTDSFGATCGSILGAFFGPGHLDSRWLTPLNDDIRTGVNCFYERSLSAVAKRMGKLPAMTLP